MPNKTITQVPVTLADILRYQVENDGGTVTVTATYRVKTNGGVQIGTDRSRVTVLTTPQRSAIVDFLNIVILPDINAGEGT